MSSKYSLLQQHVHVHSVTGIINIHAFSHSSLSRSLPLLGLLYNKLHYAVCAPHYLLSTHRNSFPLQIFPLHANFTTTTIITTFISKMRERGIQLTLVNAERFPKLWTARIISINVRREESYSKFANYWKRIAIFLHIMYMRQRRKMTIL